MHKGQVAEWLRAARRWMANWDAMDKSHILLSPKILSPNNKEDKVEEYRYLAVRELRNAIDSDRCNNIAITGVYGSGKSSVIQTYLAELNPYLRKRKVLNISLSNFIDADLIQEGEVPGNYENVIEQKIFQHILYKTNQNKTRQTRHGRISHVSISAGIWRAFAILLGVISVFLLFVPTRVWPMNIESWFNSQHPCIQAALEWGAVAYLCLLFVCITAYLIRRAHLLRIHAKINSSSMELEWEKDSSKLDKLLDEILYFFKAGGYKIVIFEDLDRILKPERLFLKLREINTLLNESDYYKRRGKSIKFVYAIRDEIFSSDIRTKCFDYIIPVIPIVDKYNAGDYMIDKYRPYIMTHISKRDLSVMGMYISGKRELSNVINEYGMYHDAFLDASKSERKLLALLIYKNAYPEDYAAAYTKSGCLYSIFAPENKERFYQSLIKKDEEVVAAEQANVDIQRQHIRDKRHEVLQQLALVHVDKLYIKGEEYDLEDFETKDQLYEAFSHDKIDKCYYDDGKERRIEKYNMKFAELVRLACPDGNYDEEMSDLRRAMMTSVENRDARQKRINVIKNMKVSGLIKQLGAESAKAVLNGLCASVYLEKYKELNESLQQRIVQHAALLNVFIKEEYIAEDYSGYMSHTYDGSLDEDDRVFVDSILQGIPLSFDYPIKNGEAIVARLNSENYAHESILNIKLVDYLIKAKKTDFLELVVKTARNIPKFIVQYADEKGSDAPFVNMIFNNWQGVVSLMTVIGNAEVSQSMFLLYWKQAPISGNINDAEKTILESMYGFICQHLSELNLSAVKRFVEKREIRFEALQKPDDATKVWFDIVTTGSHFAITLNNLRVIYGDDFEHSSFTQIYKGNEKVKAYLLQNVNNVMALVPETSINEAEETLVALIDNVDISDDILAEYVQGQNVQIDVAEIKIDNRLPKLLATAIIRPTWENVGNCYKRVKDKQLLVDYVKRNVDELNKYKCEVDNAFDLESLLLEKSNMINEEEYGKLVSCFLEPLDANQIEGLSETCLRYLNNQDLLYFDDDTIIIMSSQTDKLFAEYLKMNFEEFISYEDELPVNITNGVGIELLNSALTLEQKKQFMKQYPFDKEGEKAREYAPIYCFYSEKIGDYADVDMSALIDAMEMTENGGECWRLKMSIINQINRTLKYNQERETRLLNTLGDPYNQFSHYGYHTPKLDNNLENTELLEYLKVNHPFVSDVKPTIGNQWKITFKHKGEG